MDLRIVSIELFQQLVDLRGQLDNAQFTKKTDLLMGSSIGQHYRHIVEFFDCLKNGYLDGRVSYDKRAHDKSLEESAERMQGKLQELIDWVGAAKMKTSLELEVSYPLSKMEATVIPSNFERELVYNIEHAVHHMAIIKIAVMQQYPHVKLVPHFGVAQSTVVYKEKMS